MGNYVTVIVNAVMAEAVKKVKSLGYHSYNFDFENNITIEGIRNNPKCKVFARKSSISAEELFVLHGVTTDPMGRLCVDIKIPTIKLNIGKAGFICNEPKFSGAVAGWIQLLNTHLEGTLSVDFKNKLKFDYVSIKPKITEIKSEIQLAVNGKDHSQLGNSLLRSQDPAMLNLILALIMKSYEPSILEFLNTHMPEMDTPVAFD